MTDAPNGAAPVLATGDAAQSDEQLWNDFEADQTEDHAQDDEQEDPPAADDDEDDGWNMDGDEDEPDGSSEDNEDDGEDSTNRDDPEHLRAQVERLQHALNSEKGRTAASRREIDTLKAQIAEAEKSASRSQRDENLLKERREQLNRAREEYGDVVGPLADTIADLEARMDDLSAREQRELSAMREQHNTLLAAEEGKFIEEHPDGFDTIIANREAFDAWIEDQPKRLRDIYAENAAAIVDGTGASYLVGLFKQALHDAGGGHAPASDNSSSRLQSRRQRQLDGARAARGGTQRSSSTPSRDSGDAEAHWDYFERLDRQKGRR
jgi:hypothetical protein